MGKKKKRLKITWVKRLNKRSLLRIHFSKNGIVLFEGHHETIVWPDRICHSKNKADSISTQKIINVSLRLEMQLVNY